MPILQVQDEFQSGDNVTATSLNNLVEQASFDNGAVDNATLQIDSLGSGYLKVKDNGILSNHLKSEASDTNDAQRAVTANHIRNDAVTNAKIANLAVDTEQIAADAVEFSKMQNMDAKTIIGNNTDASANPTAIPIDDLKDSISNAEPHDGGPVDSDGLNTTSGTDGLLSAYDKTKLNSIAVNANNYSHPTGDGNLHVPATSTTNHRKLLTAGPTAGSLTWSHNNEALVGSTYTNLIAKALSGSSGVPVNSQWPTFHSSSITATRSGRNAWIVGTYVLNTTYPSITSDHAYFTIEMPNSWKAYNTNTVVHYSHGWHRSESTLSSSSYSSGRQRHGQAEIRGIPGTTDDGIVLYIERESGRYLYGGTFYVSFLLDDASMNS